MRIFFVYLAMFGSFSFFILLASFSMEYKGIAESNIYIVYNFLVMLGISIYFFPIFIRLRKKEFYLLLVLFLFVLSHVVQLIINGGEIDFFNNKFVFFLVWVLPAIMSAIILYRLKDINEFVKKADFLLLILFVSVLNSIIIPSLSGPGFSTFGGGTYQLASYMSSLGFGLAFYLLLFGSKHDRYGFFKSVYYNAFLLFSLFLFAIGVVIPGGRGAFVLLVIYLLFFLFKLFKSIRTYSSFIYIILFFLIMFFAFVLVGIYIDVDILLPGFNRAVDFINFESGVGINWEGTSGRDSVYTEAISEILEKPFLGYGLFGFEGFPHNLFLDVVMQGGVVYLAFFVPILFFLLLKVMYFIFNNKEYDIFFVFYAFSLVSLMFSGTYLSSSFFWFLNAFFYLLITDKKHTDLQ